MTTRTTIAILIWMMAAAVLTGIGIITVLSVPQLNNNATFWLPVVIAAGLVISPIIAWQIAPMLRARWQRTHERSMT